MTALTKSRKTRPVSMTTISLVLATGVTVYEGGLACIELADGTAVKGKVDDTLLPVGLFIDLPETGLLGDGTKKVKIRLFKEVLAFWFANATAGDAVTAADVGSFCWVLDDQTATGTSTGASVLGRVWGVDSSKGVLVEPSINIGPAGADGA